MIGAVPSIPEHGKSLSKLGRKPCRKLLLAVKTWGSEESIHSWKYLKSHLLQAKDGSWRDELVVVHVSKSKDKEKGERWDQGGAVIASLQTALQPYKHDIFDLEGDAGPLLVDIANKEQADILVLATRGRNVMKKAMMGSMTDFVMQRAGCACLVVKPQIGAGDTYRMKSAVQPPAALPNLQPPRAQSPASSPMYRSGSLPGITPFNRRVAIAYDTTASGRFLLKWAADNILEPADNVFVVRAVPKMRKPGTSFADKDSVQRLARDALQGLPHITTFNLPQVQGNARKSVLNFAAKESVDLLVIGMYKPSTRRKGLGLRGNATMIANRCACPCLVVPMSDAALVATVKAADLALAAAEEEELDSGSESDTDEEEPSSPTAAVGAAAYATGDKGDTDEEGHGAVTPPSKEQDAADSPETGGLSSFRAGSAAAIKQIRAPLEALFKRRGFGSPSFSDAGASASLVLSLDARKSALLAALQGTSSSLQPGRYVVEVDNHGLVRSIHAPGEKQHHPSQHVPPQDVASSAVGATATVAETSTAAVAVSTVPSAPSANGCVDDTDERGMVESLEGGIPEKSSRTAAEVPPGVQLGDADVQRVRVMLAEREAEVQALRMQLQQLNVGANQQ